MVWGGGYSSQVWMVGGIPRPGLDDGGIPQEGLDAWGGYPSQVLMVWGRGTPARSGWWGVPWVPPWTRSGWWGVPRVPLPRSGWCGGTQGTPHDWMGYPSGQVWMVGGGTWGIPPAKVWMVGGTQGTPMTGWGTPLARSGWWGGYLGYPPAKVWMVGVSREPPSP